MSFRQSLFLFSIFLPLLFVGRFFNVSAQETFGKKLAEADENLVTQEIEQELLARFQSDILPGNPLYFFKTFGREVQALITLNPEKDAELRLRYANEKILEANILADQGKAERAAEHLKSYVRELERVRQSTIKLEERDKEAAQKLLEKTVKSELKHQILIGKVEREAPSEKTIEVKETREKVLEQLVKSIERLDNKKTEQVISAAFNNNGSPFKQLRNLEVLKSVEEKVPEQAKEAIQKAQENSLKRFKNQIEVLPDEHKELFVEYVEDAGGDETAYLKVFDNLKFMEPSAKAQEYFIAAKEKIFVRLEKKVEAAQEDPKLAVTIFKPLIKGNIEDLRVIQEIEQNLSRKLLAPIAAVKQEAIQNFIQEPEKAVKALEKINDIRQLRIVDELTSKWQQKFEGVRTKISEKIATEGRSAKSFAEKEKKLSLIVDDSTESIETITKYFGNRLGQDLLSAQAKHLEKRVAAIEEGKRVEALKERIRSDAVIKNTLLKTHPEFILNLYRKGALVAEKVPSTYLQCPSPNSKRVFPPAPYDFDNGNDCSVIGRESELTEYVQALADLAETCRNEAESELAEFTDTRESLREQIQNIPVTPPPPSPPPPPKEEDSSSGELLLEPIEPLEPSESSCNLPGAVSMTDGAEATLEGEGEGGESAGWYTNRYQALRTSAMIVCQQRDDIMNQLAAVCSNINADAEWLRDYCRIEPVNKIVWEARLDGVNPAATNALENARSYYDGFVEWRASLEDYQQRNPPRCPQQSTKSLQLQVVPVAPIKAVPTITPKALLPLLPEKTLEPKILPSPPASVKPVSTPVPVACLKDYVPVCGTDNKTYNNSCYAKQAGVEVQYGSKCKIVTP